ncbi:MAG: S8 family serine peptidase [Eubacterium sp.]
MKKFIAVILSVLFVVMSSVHLICNDFTERCNIITHEEAKEFADELKKIDGAVSNRLIVSADKDIDYMGASEVADGIEGLFVLQYENKESAENAFEYYNSLTYINYVEYDVEENALCEAEADFDFVPKCYSTVNCNIDDTIKLLYKENYNFPEMIVGIIDSGILLNERTKDRFVGGYSYIDGYAEDGTDDKYFHGTLVAGTIINNTLDNVKVKSYQTFNQKGLGIISKSISAMYLAVTEGCKILNCSFNFLPNETDRKSMTDAVNYATEQGVYVVGAAGNESSSLDTFRLCPASIDNVISVGAFDSSNTLADFSNFGTKVDIYTTGDEVSSYGPTGKPSIWDGTSASAPVAVSIISHLLVAKPNITVDEITDLLRRTGKAGNNDKCNTNNLILADAYAAVKELTGKELEQVKLDYSVCKNTDTACPDITFSCDENADVYYNLGYGIDSSIPFQEKDSTGDYSYENGTTVNLNEWQNVTACAYAPGKAKSKIQLFMAPTYSDGSGYLLTQSSSDQQYNCITCCQLNDKLIEVPQYIDSSEVQEIGKFCFSGNKTVEKIILPESVKQIDDYAFANCPNLKTVIAPGAESCGMYAFYNCDSLINVEMNNLTVANTGLFKNCKSLKNFNSGNLTLICNHSFYGCASLLEINSDINSVNWAYNTFKDCGSFLSSISGHTYKYFSTDDNVVIYKCSDCGMIITRDIDYLKNKWNSDLVNVYPSSNLFDSNLQFDIVPDGIINGKDYSKLLHL